MTFSMSVTRYVTQQIYVSLDEKLRLKTLCWYLEKKFVFDILNFALILYAQKIENLSQRNR